MEFSIRCGSGGDSSFPISSLSPPSEGIRYAFRDYENYCSHGSLAIVLTGLSRRRRSHAITFVACSALPLAIPHCASDRHPWRSSFAAIPVHGCNRRPRRGSLSYPRARVGEARHVLADVQDDGREAPEELFSRIGDEEG